MEKIPTAWAFITNHPGYLTGDVDDETLMIEFTKMHVEAALKAKVKAMIEKRQEDSSYSIAELDAFTRDSYPLDNIK